MFPTMELMLRHARELNRSVSYVQRYPDLNSLNIGDTIFAVNYLGMKRNPLISMSGVLDSETDFIADMSLISLEEARAVLCVYMMCCALDGSIDNKEFVLWKALLLKVRTLPAAACKA
eukprot:COSAG02_NODE_2978_length_7629_cov_3.880478_4_plen_118_part_00